MNQKIKKNIITIILILIVIILFFVFNNKNDGMENEGILNTYYRVYTKKGWSKWSKNGIVSGNKNDDIKKIQIKTRGVDPTTFDIYNGHKWISDAKETKENKITALKFYNSYEFLKKYQMCYRTYNKKNKWLNWTCDNSCISGTENETITAIEIKTIPSNVIYYEYLKDYAENKNESFIGF